jgi:trimethylamine--corrinoid protein Co-methyltransferase
MNQLEHLSMCGAVVMPQDVPVSISEVIQIATKFRLGQKPGAGSAVSNAAQARYVAELYQTMASDVDDLYKYPIMCIGISPESPLVFPKGYRRRHESLDFGGYS